MRAERRLGEMIREQKETVGLQAGSRGIGKSTSGLPTKQPTLADAGIDHKFSSRATQGAQMKREEKFKRLVSALRRKLGKEDYDARLLTRKRQGIRPSLILILAEMQVRMDGTKNHRRPHLHLAIGRSKHAASVAIDDGTVLAGKLTKMQERVIRDWVVRNRLPLINLWKTFQAGKPVGALIQEFKQQRF